jgi:hypothetical protein
MTTKITRHTRHILAAFAEALDAAWAGRTGAADASASTRLRKAS